jgi:hypothetical protein
MASLPHPVTLVYGPGNVDKADPIALHKEHIRTIVADADEVRNTDFSGQFGGLYIRANRANYNLDTESVAADDGVNVIIDGVGTHFLKAVDSFAPTVVEYDDGDVVAGTITIGEATDIAIIDVTTSVDVAVPASADRNGRILEIKSVGAGGFTPVLDGAETIDGNAASGYAITTVGGLLRLAPRSGGYALIGSQL